eukprot:TRINITY_DN56977_c0_g1_i1.p1 TRINITY_DN56977_c0_g1~~TRINITY_DN56977_c0_g1_i1.p1  ORF type:complete len:1337 (-),score=230.55 TRINITY_DN56977_c0_g1_i1:19-3948(-)
MASALPATGAAAVQVQRSRSESMGYVRQPTVCGELIVVVVEGDLWLVDCSASGAGATAPAGPLRPRRLTMGLGAAWPVFSQRGDFVAFTVCSDVWIFSMVDGRHRQLTWFGWGRAQAVAWTDVDGEPAVVVTTTSQDAFDRPCLFKVPLRGGGPHRVCNGEFDFAQFSVGADGCGVLLGRHVQDRISGLSWKGYRGGRYGRLWFDCDGSGSYKELVLLDNEGGAPEGTRICISCPTWCQERVWFISDHDGSANVWSMSLDGANLTKHTDHDFFDARCAQSDAQSIVYTHAGELWLIRANGKPEHVILDFGAASADWPKYLSPELWCEAVALHPDGHHCAVLCRGQLFEMALWEGPAVRLQQPLQIEEGAVQRAVRCEAFEYLFSGRILTLTDECAPLTCFTIHASACLTDSDSPVKAREWLSLFMADTGVPPLRMTTEEPIGQIEDLVPSPAHDAVVITTARNQLLLVEFVAEGCERPNPQADPYARADTPLQVEVTVLDSSDWEEGISEPCWSPDGEWLAYIRRDAYYGSSLILMNLETKERTVVADSSFANSTPSFDPNGAFLSFISARTFAPLEDDITMDLGFSVGAQLPYLCLLQKDSPNPFHRVVMSPAQFAEAAEGGGGDEEWDEGPPPEEDRRDEGEEEQEDQFQPPEKIEVDLEGIRDRILQFPVPLGKYACGQWTDDGKFQYLRGCSAARPQNVGGESQDEEDSMAYTLYAYDFKSQKETKLASHVRDYHVSMDLKNMLLCLRGEDDIDEYRVHVAGQKPPYEDEEAAEDMDLDRPGPESGLLDFEGRISLEVVPRQEWEQIFGEICCHVAEMHYDENCAGVDWPATCEKYRAMLPRLRVRSDLTDLCCEMLAELGVSHVSLTEAQPDDEPPLAGGQGQLGAELSWREMEGGGAYRVDKLAHGDTWDPRYSGPLTRPGVGMTEGSLIVAINRTRVCREVSIAQMLANLGNIEVFVTFVPPEGIASFEKLQKLLQKGGGADGFRRLNAQQQRTLQSQSVAAKKKAKNKKKSKDSKSKDKKGNAKGQGAFQAAQAMQAEVERCLADMLARSGLNPSEGPMWKTVRVHAIGESVSRNARMRDLVERRCDAVHSATSDRVGYLHVPDTSEFGFAEFYRYFSRESAYPALIVDLRCNGGGYASELLLKKLRERPIGWSVPRSGRGRPTVCPGLCPSGQTILLVDENTASDGECWAEAFQRFKLGIVVGMRTWGGVVEIGSADIELLDGAELSIPAAHYYAHGGAGYGLENFGALPDVVVDWPPDSKEEDPQLAEGVRQALKLLSSAPPKPEIPRPPAVRQHRRAR